MLALHISAFVAFLQVRHKYRYRDKIRDKIKINKNLFKCIYTFIGFFSEKVFCIDPGSVFHAQKVPIRKPPRFKPGEIILYNCDFPYQFNKGNGVIMCLKTGTWNSSLPRCICHPGDFILNGTHYLKNLFWFYKIFILFFILR